MLRYEPAEGPNAPYEHVRLDLLQRSNTYRDLSHPNTRENGGGLDPPWPQSSDVRAPRAFSSLLAFNAKHLRLGFPRGNRHCPIIQRRSLPKKRDRQSSTHWWCSEFCIHSMYDVLVLCIGMHDVLFGSTNASTYLVLTINIRRCRKAKCTRG